MITYEQLKARTANDRSGVMDEIEVVDFKNKGSWEAGIPTLLRNGKPRKMKTVLVMKALFTNKGEPKNNVQTARFMIYEDYKERFNISKNVMEIDPAALEKYIADQGYVKANELPDTNPISQAVANVKQETDKEIFERLQREGKISGNVKFKETESAELNSAQ